MGVLCETMCSLYSGRNVGEVAERSKAVTCNGCYAAEVASEVRILPLSANDRNG